LLQITCIYKTEAAAIRNTRQLAKDLQAKLGEKIEVLGPAPAFYERRHGTYRWQLLVKAQKRSSLQEAVQLIPAANWQFELDPISLI
jgi:primosomal protein N' (replication factor Y)